MPRPRKAIPSVVHHKSTGQARVRIGGRDFYLGRYGSQEAREAYVRLLGEIQTAGLETVRMVRELNDDSSSPTVAELCLAFLDHAEATYRKNGRATSTCSTFKTPIRALRTLYGDTPAKDFGPIALEAVRQLFVVSFRQACVNLSDGLGTMHRFQIHTRGRWTDAGIKRDGDKPTGRGAAEARTLAEITVRERRPRAA